MFYPGTPVAANATPVTVRAGEVREGIDIPIAMVRVGTISGVVRGIDGQPTQNVQLSVAPGGPSAHPAGMGSPASAARRMLTKAVEEVA